MNGRRTMAMLVMAAAVAAVVALSEGRVAAQGGAATPTRVVVVDIQKAFTSLDQRSQVEAEITAKTEALQREAQDRQQALRSRRSDIDTILEPGSDEYKQAINDLERDTIEFTTWYEFQGRKLEIEKALQLENLYRALTETIARLAERNGYDLVLQRDDSISVNQRTQQALANMIVQRKVLFASQRIDITDAVIQQANNEFNSRQAGGEGG